MCISLSVLVTTHSSGVITGTAYEYFFYRNPLAKIKEKSSAKLWKIGTPHSQRFLWCFSLRSSVVAIWRKKTSGLIVYTGKPTQTHTIASV